MLLERVKIDDIIVPDVRVTAQYDAEALEKMRATCRGLGILGTVILVKVGDHYEVADGKNRIDRARELGETELDAAVMEGSSEDTLLYNLALTRSHGKTKTADMVRVIRELAEVHGLDSDAIREKTGLTRDYIERIMVISTAIPEVQDALDQEVIGVGHAYHIARIPSPIVQGEILAKLQVWRYTVAEIKQLADDTIQEIKALQANPPAIAAPKPAPRRLARCDACQTEGDPADFRTALVCPECFTEVWRIRERRKQIDAAEVEDTGGV